jgi:acetyltransferase
MFRDATPLFQPKSIAIVGASESGGGGWSRVLFNNIKAAGFPARTYLINPRRDELWGQKVYHDFGSLPEAVDLALVIVPAPFVNDMIRDGVAHGLKGALIYAAGFGEGRKGLGRERGEELKQIIAGSGIAVCGPNCMGSFALPRKLLLYPTSRLSGLARGPVGGVFHSGGTLGYWFAQAAERGLGFSYATSCGNEFGLDAADYLNFLVDDPDTEIIVGMIEGIRRPQAFMAAARRAFEAGKPVIITKLGRTELGKEQAKTHTGAVAVDDDVFSAACDHFGVVRCNNIDEMVDFALAFGMKRLPKGNRVAVVTSSGGAVGLVLNAVGEEGAELARLDKTSVLRMEQFAPEEVDIYNPIDAGSTLAADVIRFCKLCEMFAADPNVDALAIQARIPLPDDKVQSPQPYVDILGGTDKPVIGYTRMIQNADEQYRRFQAGSGMPITFGIPTTVRTLQALVRYAARRRAGIPALPPPGGKAEKLKGNALTATLASHGLAAPRQSVAKTPAEAADAAAKIGFPIALKIVSSSISHKTEVGGVRLGLADAAAVKIAAEGFLSRLGRDRVDGFLVQEMVSGVELLVGARDDEQFGPLLVVGIGGVFVEVFRDVALRLMPVDENGARAMLGELRGAKLLDGFRGQAPRDVGALARAIAGLSRFFLDHRPWLAEIEINPLIVLADGQGVRAVDVRPIYRS